MVEVSVKLLDRCVWVESQLVHGMSCGSGVNRRRTMGHDVP
jgi:hypothetical protein